MIRIGGIDAQFKDAVTQVEAQDVVIVRRKDVFRDDIVGGERYRLVAGERN
ncbi:hypothetical protein [Asticcacaulis solisilvae]|uniref:hypothetical protein n=1 Tax=Asticcacaulis solisilvae TaxID=1217274 RepID=UPI003FD8963A